MIKAGVTIIEALRLMEEQTESKKLKRAIKEVQASVEKGESLATAMAEQKVFPNLMM